MPLPSEHRRMLEDVEKEYGRQARKKAGAYLARGMTPEEAMEELERRGVVSSPGSSYHTNPGPEKKRFPLPGIFPPTVSRVKARNALNKAGGHLSYADTALSDAQEVLEELGLDDAAEEVQSTRDRLYGINEEIGDVVRRIR